MLHSPPISFFSILSPARYWVRSTDHSAPHYVITLPKYISENAWLQGPAVE
jgi:hypothetical protein